MSDTEGWTPTKFAEIGYTYAGLTGKTKADFGKGRALYVTFLGVIENVTVGIKDTERVDVADDENQNRVIEGDLLFNGTSETPGELAMGAVVGEDVPSMFVNSFCFGFRIRDTSRYDARFLAYLSRGGPGRSAARPLAQGATRYNISKTRFMQTPQNLPGFEEQRAIAEVLSDVDRLLVALDALIAKKHAIQQATMQQLLTGRTRLPGWSRDWHVVRLGEVVEIVSGGTPWTQNAEYWNGGIPWCVPTDITRDSGKYLRTTARTITESGLANSAANILPPGSLLLCSRATIGEVKLSIAPICTNQGFKALVCTGRILNEFLYYLLLTLKGRLISLSNGSTFLEISKSAIASVEIRLPEFGEQREIALCLSDLDAEIEALEQRRDKTRALKQGLMQQLLTGLVRLVEPVDTQSRPAAS
ncbi:MAG: restriction endonuclease subunit S [Acidobacteria bacterium]|nr:restriction endonuclease subunit S [Acidobacteriota bacterium]